ncbi:MAG: ATP-binding cassette domain-containing protein, partial [Firmicutes bacterium]|nr:ATP-binding cassette domain-containing protein [Bacillota bacterium]
KIEELRLRGVGFAIASHDRELLGKDPQETAAKAEALLAEFGLTRLKDRATLTLSRGEKQRLALAALLMGGAGFFILDEPTTGLDGDNRRILYDKIEELRQRGVGFAIASHDRELLGLWSRRLLLREGRVVYED